MRRSLSRFVVGPLFAFAIAASGDAYAQDQFFCAGNLTCFSGDTTDNGIDARFESDGAGSQAVFAVVPNGGVAVFATDNPNSGAPSGTFGVLAEVGGGIGVLGTSVGNHGVEGDSTNSIGVKGVSSGYHGVYGTTSSGRSAGVYGNNSGSGFGVVGAVTGSNNTGIAVYGNNTSPDGYAGFFSGSVLVSSNLYVQGSCTGCGGGSSDIRLKKDVAPIASGEALQQLLQLKGVTFQWTNPEKQGNQTGTQRGFIAQDVEKVFPNWVHEGKDGFKVLDYRQTEALEVESIRALKAENDSLTARVKSLEDARRHVASMNTGGLWLGVAGLAIAGGAAVSRRRREREPS